MVARAGVVMELAEWEAETVVVTVVGARVVAATAAVRAAAALVEEAGKAWAGEQDLREEPREGGSGVVTVAEAPVVVTVAFLVVATARVEGEVTKVETRAAAGSSAPLRSRLPSHGVAERSLRFERCTKSRSPREAYRSREGRGPTNLQNRPVHLTRGSQVRLQPGARR